MANDNTIGVIVELDTSDLDAKERSIQAKIKAIEGGLDKAEKAAEGRAKARENAEKQESAAIEKAANAEEKAANKRERSIRKFGIAFAAVSIAVVKGYEALRDAATEFGDAELAGKFNEIDTTLSSIKDTFTVATLEILKASDALTVVSDGLAALNQLLIIVGANFAGFAAIAGDVIGGANERARASARFQGPTSASPEMIAKQTAAYRNAFQSIVTAPGRATSTANIAKASAEADKQRQKDTQAIYDYYKKVEDLQIKAGEDILSAQQDFNDKSAEAWQEYIDKTSDIIAEGVQKRAELARDYAEKIADAETDYNKGVESAAIDHGQRMADIERDYQRTIAAIQGTYQEDALDAIRNLDAIALIRAREKRDKDLAAAAQSRDDAQSDESRNYTRQLYELQKSLDDKKKEAQLAYQRGLEDQRRAEQEAIREAKSAYNKQVSDAAQAQADKLAAIQRGYNNENAAAQAQYGYAESAYRAHLAAMQALTAAYGIGAGTTSRGGAGTIHRRQEGGLDVVNSPTQFLAGEAGPELVYTAPLNRSVPYAIPQVVTHTGEFQHSIDSTIRSSVAGIDGRIVAAVSKVLREVLG